MNPYYVIHYSAPRFTGRTIPEGCTETSLVLHIIGGHVDGKIDRIDWCFPDEGTCRTVTEDVARAVANHYEANRWDAMSPEIRDFIEENAGLAFTRGLRVADHSFAAA